MLLNSKLHILSVPTPFCLKSIIQALNRNLYLNKFDNGLRTIQNIPIKYESHNAECVAFIEMI